MKRTVKTIVKKFDHKGSLLEHTETTVEEIVDETYVSVPDYISHKPVKPWKPCAESCVETQIHKYTNTQIYILMKAEIQVI
jgi:hypothetical protein